MDDQVSSAQSPAENNDHLEDDSTSVTDMSASPETERPRPIFPTSPSPVYASSFSPPSTASLLSANASGRPTAPTMPSRGNSINMPSDLQARLKAFHLGRQGAPPNLRATSSASDGAVPSNVNSSPGGPFIPSPSPGTVSPPSGALIGGMPSNLRLPGGKPTIANMHSSPAVPGRMPPKKPSLADKRGLVLPGGLSGVTGSPTPPAAIGRKKPGFTLSQMRGTAADPAATEAKPVGGTMIDKYANYLDAKTGTLRFKGKATLSSQGVEFASGNTFSISLDEVDTLDELGKGNYGTVYRVKHSRPRIRKVGQGLAGNKSTSMPSQQCRNSDSPTEDVKLSANQSGTTGVIMAMKEIRLELDDAKFSAIIMELDVLHRCTSPYIVDFYGAFFQEGAVYICMEFMNGGSIDKLYGGGIPESVLRKIAYGTVMGLKSLKEEHNVIHRDVKPTNILINTRGQVKICDFGVSGNLVASFAKTNIGCQSYMAPERISSGGVAMAGNPGGTYSVQSDIWSLGLSIIECAMGRYPYPPETYNNIFSQLSVSESCILSLMLIEKAIVEGDPPDLPSQGYSASAHNFVSGCLNKIPKLRPTYPMLLQHAWLAPLVKPTMIMEEDEESESSVAAGTSSNPSAEPTPDSMIDLPSDVVDREVAEWVIQAIERKRQGNLGAAPKPALHAAPLDAVKTPGSGSEVQLEEPVKPEVGLAELRATESASAPPDVQP
jgi:mitogen-activated protein kinase kinase